MPAHDPFYTVLPDDAWKGERCFIVGGGPSLRGFDFDRLGGELTIGVNLSFEAFDPTVWFSTSTRLVDWIEGGQFGEALLERFDNEIHSLKCLVTEVCGSWSAEIFTLRPVKESDRLASSMRDGIFSGPRGRGCNSGLGALNLALCLGADPIYLLGFDMKGGEDGRQAWHHSSYHVVQSASVYVEFIQAFEGVSQQAMKKAQIVNMNPQSSLRCFRFENIEDVLPKNYGRTVRFFREFSE